MRRVLELASKGLGTTSPNPCVGAVIVKNNRLISQGFHRCRGQDHAEAIAIKRAAALAKGATLYVNLEPCTHYGRTPPCIFPILKSGVVRVVIAQRDPNPVNFGRGIRILGQKGISVRVGVLEKEARRLNRPFEKWVTRKLPYVTIKTAQSLDGKIATRTGESRWISSEKSRLWVQNLRKIQDAILVGSKTVRRDDPRLDVRGGTKRPPLKVVLDSRLSVPLGARLFRTRGDTLIFTAKKSNAKRHRLLSKKAELVVAPKREGRVHLRWALRHLAARGVVRLLVEGGGEVNASFIEEGLADEIFVFVCPHIIGGRKARTSVEGKGISCLDRVHRLKDLSMMKVGEDFLFHGYFPPSPLLR